MRVAAGQRRLPLAFEQIAHHSGQRLGGVTLPPVAAAQSIAGLQQAGAVLSGHSADSAHQHAVRTAHDGPVVKAAARILRGPRLQQTARFGRAFVRLPAKKAGDGRIAGPNGVHGRRICGRKAA